MAETPEQDRMWRELVRMRELEEERDRLAEEVRRLRLDRHGAGHSRVSESAERERRMMEALLAGIPDAVATVDGDMRLTMANAAFLQMFGLERAAVLGKALGDLVGGCREGCLETVRRAVYKKEPIREFRFNCAKSERQGRVVVINTSPLVAEDGGWDGAVLTVRDVSQVVRLESELHERRSFRRLVGKSEAMAEVFGLLERLSGLDSSVLIVGESGTGKELATEALHMDSLRAEEPLVRVNCAALSEELLDSELFGHMKGAFTGAYQDRAGRVETAEGGTIFLDEIGDISERVQVKLLRFLEHKQYQPLGSDHLRDADVRVVAATNADLEAKVVDGRFRSDLYYRLKVVVVTMPPLRDRRDDIPLLVEHFVRGFRFTLGREGKGPDRDALRLMLEYGWPGNVRELKHAIEQACVLCPDGQFGPEHLPPEVRSGVMPGREKRRAVLTREDVVNALEQARQNRSRAARLLGVSRSTLYRKLEQWSIPADCSI